MNAPLLPGRIDYWPLGWLKPLIPQQRLRILHRKAGLGESWLPPTGYERRHYAGEDIIRETRTNQTKQVCPKHCETCLAGSDGALLLADAHAFRIFNAGSAPFTARNACSAY